MAHTKLTALAAAGVALAVLTPATAIAKATHPGTYKLNRTEYVYRKPGKRFDGTLFSGNRFKVERLSPSGKWAYGMAYGGVKRHDWIRAAALR
jgi:hypothetical protein